MKVVARNAGLSLWGRPALRVNRNQELEERGSVTPVVGVSGLVDVELWFAQAAGGLSAATIGNLLDMLLRREKLVDLLAQRNVFAVGDFLGDHFESKRGIADPSVEVVWVNGVRAGDDDSGLLGGRVGLEGDKRRWRGERTNAPDDLEPSGPMFAKTPALAARDSVAIYESMGEGPKRFSTQENTKAVNSTLRLRMVAGRRGTLEGGHEVDVFIRCLTPCNRDTGSIKRKKRYE